MPVFACGNTSIFTRTTVLRNRPCVLFRSTRPRRTSLCSVFRNSLVFPFLTRSQDSCASDLQEIVVLAWSTKSWHRINTKIQSSPTVNLFLNKGLAWCQASPEFCNDLLRTDDNHNGPNSHYSIHSCRLLRQARNYTHICQTQMVHNPTCGHEEWHRWVQKCLYSKLRDLWMLVNTLALSHLSCLRLLFNLRI